MPFPSREPGDPPGRTRDFDESRCRQSPRSISTAIASPPCSSATCRISRWPTAPSTASTTATRRLAVHDGLLSRHDRPDRTAADHRRRGRQGLRHRRTAATEALAEAGRKWITSVAAGPQGAIAYAHRQHGLRAIRRRQDEGIPSTRAPSRASPFRPRACASASPATTA